MDNLTTSVAEERRRAAPTSMAGDRRGAAPMSDAQLLDVTSIGTRPQRQVRVTVPFRAPATPSSWSEPLSRKRPAIHGKFLVAGGHKLYVRGVGTVLEQTQKGGDERNELVAVTTKA